MYNQTRFLFKLTNLLFFGVFQIRTNQSIPTHQPAQNIFCQICNLGFPDLSALNTHYNTAHTAPVKTIKALSFFCRICEKGYKDRNSLIAHEYSAHGLGKAPRKCRFCDARFMQYKQLKKHIEQNH